MSDQRSYNNENADEQEFAIADLANNGDARASIRASNEHDTNDQYAVTLPFHSRTDRRTGHGASTIGHGSSTQASPIPRSEREVFPRLPTDNTFRNIHNQYCIQCWQKGSLIYCQGCNHAYCRKCGGDRTAREHLVTKVAERHHVLQCCWCVDTVDPDLGRCHYCKVDGVGCIPFRQQTTAKQDQEWRDQNNGLDPITAVEATEINQASEVLFRCAYCWRAWHIICMPGHAGSEQPGRMAEISQLMSGDACANCALRFGLETATG